MSKPEHLFALTEIPESGIIEEFMQVMAKQGHPLERRWIPILWRSLLWDKIEFQLCCDIIYPEMATTFLLLRTFALRYKTHLTRAARKAVT